MSGLNYEILELKEDGENLWARIRIAKEHNADLALDGNLQELGRRIEPYGLKPSEALSWMLTIPGLDEFFGQVVEHKKRIMQ